MKVIEIIKLVGWTIGNMIIFSGMLYLSYYVVNDGVLNWDSLLIAIIMIIWVFGQLDNYSLKEESKR